MRAGIQVEGHAKAVSELCATFDRYRQGSSAWPWWPAMISLSEYSNGTANSERQARPSWCYGTLGIVHLASRLSENLLPTFQCLLNRGDPEFSIQHLSLSASGLPL
jgi:hypothetical protein